jgi:hypothetical protein
VCLELFPEGEAGGHGVVPREMVEPEEEFLRACSGVIVKGCQGLVVLVYGGGAGAGAVKTDAIRTSLVVIARHPVLPGAGDVTAGVRAKVVLPGKEVVEAKRHAVVHAGFAGMQKRPTQRFPSLLRQRRGKLPRREKHGQRCQIFNT